MKIVKGYHKGIAAIYWYLHMITGILFVFYILVNAAILFLLLCGERTFDSVMKILHSPALFILEMILFAGALFHMLNGLRVLCFDAGYWIKDQKDIAYTILFILGAIFLFHFIPVLEQFVGIIF